MEKLPLFPTKLEGMTVNSPAARQLYRSFFSLPVYNDATLVRIENGEQKEYQVLIDDLLKNGEISANVQEAASGTQQVDETISGVRDGAHATGASASEVLAAAQSLNQQSASLRSEVTAFLEKVRAA